MTKMHFMRGSFYFVEGLTDTYYEISLKYTIYYVLYNKSTKNETRLIVYRLIISWVHIFDTNLSFWFYIQ